MTGTRASVYIKVGTSLEMVDDITPSTTVGEVTRRLSNARHRFKPQVLLEVWNGCSRLMHHEEFLLDSLNKWGNQIRTITFVMMDKERYTNESSLRIARNKGRRTTRQSCLRMSCRKRLAVRLTRKHKILLKSELKSKLRKELMQCREERRCLAEMIRGSSATQLRNEQAILSKLSPSLRLQHAGLSNEVAKLSQSNEELERHKRELNQTLANRKQEIRSLQAAIESKQKQVRWHYSHYQKIKNNFRPKQ